MFFLLAAFFLPEVLAICYYPDGSVAPQDTPCNPAGNDTFCCGQGYVCLSNTICMSIPTTDDPNSHSTYVRGSCSDQSWDSANCPLFCLNPQYDDTAGGEGMQKCPKTSEDSYCCTDDTLSSCNCTSGAGTVHFEGQPFALTTIGVKPTTTSSTTTSTLVTTFSISINTERSSSNTLKSSPTIMVLVTPSIVAPPSGAPSQSHTNNDATGAGVGVPLAIIVVVLLYLFFLRRRKAPKHGNTGVYELPGRRLDEKNGTHELSSQECLSFRPN